MHLQEPGTLDAHGLPGFTRLTPFPGPEMGGVVLGFWAGSSGALCCETPRAQHSLRQSACPRGHVWVCPMGRGQAGWGP